MRTKKRRSIIILYYGQKRFLADVSVQAEVELSRLSLPQGHLALELTSSPALVHSLKFIIFAFVRIGDLYEHAVLSPIQLGTQCVPFWIGAEKLTHGCVTTMENDRMSR